MAPMMANVAAALRDCGRRNAGTPSAIASTPVSAVAPDEKARSRRNTVIPVSACTSRLAVAATGQPPRHRAKPTTRVKATIATNP